MTFCIECGTKAPDIAKFCPQCGSSLVLTDPVDKVVMAKEVTAEKTPDIKEAEVVEEIKAKAEPTKPEPIKVKANVETGDASPSAEASLAAAASVIEEAPKSKSGLWVGLGLIAVLAAGGGAYALGLFGEDNSEVQSEVKATVQSPSTALPNPETAEADKPSSDAVQTAYGKAIRSGRISDLGKFASDNPESSLAKDAQTAAFASLQRQGSVLAYTTFTKFFPDADTSAYSGARVNSDEVTGAEETVEVSSGISVESEPGNAVDIDFTSPEALLPAVRPSITSRGEELEPFIAQGDIEYVTSVIDEISAYPDLNEREAMYLANLRSRAENTKRFSPATELEYTKPTQIEPTVSNNLELGIAPDIQTLPEPETPALTVPAVSPPVLADTELIVADPTIPETDSREIPTEPKTPETFGFDSPAKPIDRFGAITPDEATEPGECSMTFSVDVSGSPTNIVPDCTDSIFIEPARETVAEWTYSPATLAGQPVQQDGLVITLKFHLE